MASFARKSLLIAAVAVLVALAFAGSAAAQACQVPNCLTCDPTNQFSCTTCQDSYIPSLGQCSPTGTCGVTYCTTCVVGKVNVCSVCQAGYVITAKGLCGPNKGNAAAAPTAAFGAAATAVAVAAAYVL